MSEQPLGPDTDPEAAFAVLADETRVAILRTLWETEETPLSFSALRERVGVTDSGRFNYHLDKLVGGFVARTDEGYELTVAGRRVNGALHAGSFTADIAVEPISLEDPCQHCGGTYSLEYEDQAAIVHCDSCDIQYHFVVPARTVQRASRAELPAIASQYLLATIRHTVRGFCTNCDGPTTPAITPVEAITASVDDVPESIIEAGVPMVQYDCTLCGATVTVALELALLDHPAVVSFYHERGIDVRDRPVWTLPTVDGDSITVQSREPWRVTVTYRNSADTLALTVDDSLQVVDVDRP